LDGFFAVDKPPGVTSHDVVEAVREKFSGVKCGHAGTLDPMATGVLVVAVGRATSRIGELSGAEKEYDATVRFGITTDTDDLDGRTIREAAAPERSRDQIEDLLVPFRGTFTQRLPVYAAAKHKGEAFYAIARRGGTPPERSKDVTIHDLTLTAFVWPDVSLHVRCSAGTYVRSLARDLGAAAGCGAALSSLRRTRVGNFRIESAVTWEELKTEEPEDLLLRIHHRDTENTEAHRGSKYELHHGGTENTEK